MIRIGQKQSRRECPRNRKKALAMARALAQALKRLNALPEKQADMFQYEVSELVEACLEFPQKAEALTIGLKRACRNNAVTLMYATNTLLGELEHIKYHIGNAIKPLRQLREHAGKLPPLKNMNADELAKMWNKDRREAFWNGSKRARSRWGLPLCTKAQIRKSSKKAKAKKGANG